MLSDAPQPIYRKDYVPLFHRVDRIDLDFDLQDAFTLVRARIAVERTDEARRESEPFVLHGVDLELVSMRLDGQELDEAAYGIEGEELTIHEAPARFVLETEVRIRPHENTALQGLYQSGSMFCTQCEPHGFRRITYFPDRPDVMARYRVKVSADKERYPVLLSNGNRVATGELPDGRHWAEWEDPFPKPSYLFALVAGDLRCHPDQFVTSSGRKVALEIWVEEQNLDRCEHAMQSLKRSMAWDEQRFGLEMDLDQYMIVAVSDFNMGAMENKGLNIFNAKYVLAKPETATDDDYEAIEGVIGHEYFHNWTGNRVTCRDWFQLTLKEGLTVFRDQEFSMDMGSRSVCRISDVRDLRTVQFPEDAGPMRHPIRPDSYIEMNNFYTSTVYNKGAEVVRMYQTLLGVEGFRKGMDLYFERHDGQAVTCEDFRAAMADANGVDLDLFERWYAQSGTPQVQASGEYDAASKSYSLTLRQSCAKGTEGEEPQPFFLPVAVGLLGTDGRDLPLELEGSLLREGGVLRFTEEEQTFRFTDVPEPPVPSLFRGFSAPVRLEMERGLEELAFLTAHDSDPFNRWDAGQELAKRVILDGIATRKAGGKLELDPLFREAFGKVLEDTSLDGSMQSLALTLPNELLLGQEMTPVEVDGIHEVREFLRRELGSTFHARWSEIYEAGREGVAKGDGRAAIDARRIKNCALAYLTLAGDGDAAARAHSQFTEASNMTDSQAALRALCDLECPEREAALAAFFERWKDDPLVVDKWFAVQALSSSAKTIERVRELARHPSFTLKNPNRARSLIATFAMANQVRFHAADGAGYAFLGDQVVALDPINPQIAARLVTPFQTWRRFDESRAGLMRAQLERILALSDLSSDVREIASKSLEA